MSIHNPFHGNKAIITKKMSRKQYDEKYKDTYVYDPELGDFCDFNETSAIYVHKETGEYLLVKEKAD